MASRVIRKVRQLFDVDADAIADGETLVWDAGTEEFVPGAAGGGGGGAPTTADYLVGTAQAGLSAEIVAGTSPGGELGGTWAAPTVDAVHSGSSHAAVQAAAEATAAAALAGHDGDTTNVHGIADTSVLATDAELAAMLAQAVILAPAASARNVIQPTAGTVIAEIIKAHAAQSVDVWNVQKSDGGKYLRVGATGAVGIGEGTYDPAAYSSYLTGLVLFRADDGYYDAAVGVPFTPGADESVIGFMADIVIRPTAGGVNTEHFGVAGSMRYMEDKTAATVVAAYSEAVFLGTKAAGSGAQVERLSGNYMVAYSDASSTGDITNAYGYNGTFIHRGSGLVAALTGGYFSGDALNNSGIPTVIRGVHGRAAVAASGGTVPEMAGVRAEIFTQGRAVTVAKGLDVPNAGGSGIVTSYGLYMAAQSGATNVYGLYIAGGKSVFVDSLITGKIALPADADFANGQGGWWWDQANSLPKWKGKTSGGVVVNFVPADATGLSDHIADPTAAHAATAVGFTPAGTIAATTVQAAIEEVASEAGGGGAPTDAQYIVGAANAGLSAEIVASAFALTLLDDTTAAAARATLGTPIPVGKVVGAYYTTSLLASKSVWVVSAPASAAATMVCVPVLMEAGTLDRIGQQQFSAGVASELMRLGIYNDNGGVPGSLLLDAGTIDLSTAAAEKFITISQAVTRGLYWLASVKQGSNTTTLLCNPFDAPCHMVVPTRGTGGTNLYDNSAAFTVGSVTGALPNPFTGTAQLGGGGLQIAPPFYRYSA